MKLLVVACNQSQCLTIALQYACTELVDTFHTQVTNLVFDGMRSANALARDYSLGPSLEAERVKQAKAGGLGDLGQLTSWGA